MRIRTQSPSEVHYWDSPVLGETTLVHFCHLLVRTLQNEGLCSSTGTLQPGSLCNEGFNIEVVSGPVFRNQSLGIPPQCIIHRIHTA